MILEWQEYRWPAWDDMPGVVAAAMREAPWLGIEGDGGGTIVIDLTNPIQVIVPKLPGEDWRSQSRSRSMSQSKSQSLSRWKSRSQSRQTSASRSMSQSRSRSMSRSKSMSKSKSKSRSRSKSRSKEAVTPFNCEACRMDETLGLTMEVRVADPGAPETGQIWFRSDL